MSLSVFHNIASLVLGLAAWAVPIAVIARAKTKGCGFSIVSFSACALSLVFQIFEIRNRTHLEDWSAIMDTIDTLSWVVVVLFTMTVVLNIVAYHRISRTKG